MLKLAAKGNATVGRALVLLKNDKIVILSKIDILVKNRHIGQKSKFWSKIDILVKNRHIGQNFVEK